MAIEEIKRIAVIGAGLMGHGIAQEFALADYHVTLHDLDDTTLQTAKDNMRRNLATLAEAGIVEGTAVETVPDRVRVSTDLAESVRDADLVIEAVSEDVTLKQRIFGELDRLCPAHTILASNSSTFIPSMLSSVTKRPEKVLVTHYFNPPYLVPLVEVVRHEGTSDETFETVYKLLVGIGKRPVELRKETMGFIANRLQIALLRECASLVEKGVATPEDIDTVVQNSIGRRLSVAGPFQVFDLAGLDIISAIAVEILPDMESGQTLPSFVAKNVESGNLGVKTGKGTYDWTPETAEALRQKIAKALLEIQKWSQSE